MNKPANKRKPKKMKSKVRGKPGLTTTEFYQWLRSQRDAKAKESK